tara:strand:- start:492 stop:686 length:195 start_codon:yes stop_codon:yes gene_type:complete
MDNKEELVKQYKNLNYWGYVIGTLVPSHMYPEGPTDEDFIEFHLEWNKFALAHPEFNMELKCIL